MPMTVVVTRNAPERIRGFLASCMCEISPGVYAAPRMQKGVRERVWLVLEDWFEQAKDCSIVMTWPDAKLPGGHEVATLGAPRHELRQLDGVFLARRDLSAEQKKRLEALSKRSG